MKTPKGQAGEICPEGLYVLNCVGFIDLGTQDPSEAAIAKSKAEGYDEPKPKRKCVIEFEIGPPLDKGKLGKRITRKDGKPFIMSVYQPFSQSSKNLKAFLKTWLGSYDKNLLLGDLVGKSAVGRVVHNGEWANLEAVTEAQVKVPAPVTPERILYIDPKEWDQDVFDSLTEGLQEKIMSSPEYDEVPRPKTKATPANKKKGK